MHEFTTFGLVLTFILLIALGFFFGWYATKSYYENESCPHCKEIKKLKTAIGEIKCQKKE